MATDQSFADFVVDQLLGAGQVSAKKMFGEYAVYLQGKIVALVCDNQLYVKPTEAGRAYIGAPTLAPPYPGAKPCFLVTDQLEDREWLDGLVKVTFSELPEPKMKKRKISPTLRKR